RAKECAGAPSGVEPAIAHSAGVKYALAQRWSDHDTGDHRAKKQRPTDAKQNDGAMVAKKVQAFSQLTPEALELRFSSEDVGAYLLGTQDDVASFAHCEVAQERDHVGGKVDQQHAA